MTLLLESIKHKLVGRDEVWRPQCWSDAAEDSPPCAGEEGGGVTAE